jgi:succinate dehydrogenase / fumarate reductase iron-sulfur subunit
MATDREFIGPQAMAQAYRYNSDSRDAGNRERLGQVDVGHGLSGCHMAGSCAEACPKGVDPALGIQLLKREAVFGRNKALSGIATPPEKAERRSNIPEAPAPTVKVAGSE